MKITKLTFKNFMGYKNLNLPKRDSDFPNGLILISGKNSYGKSTILEGMLFAFFGPKIFKGRNAASFITYGVQDKAEIYIYFLLDNKKYYIFRKWGRSGSIISKLFEMDEKGIYRELKKFNIDQFFEISREQAMSTVFVRQGEIEELANKKGAELRDMIIDLFRLNIIDDALSFLDKESKSKKLEKSKLEKGRVPIERIQEDINRTKLQNKELNKSILESEKLKKELEKRFKSFPSKKIISDLEDLYKKREITLEKHNSHKNDFEIKVKRSKLNVEDFLSIKKISIKLDSLNKSKEDIDIKKKEIEQKWKATNKGIGITRNKIQETQNKINKMKSSLKFTKTTDKAEKARCPTCQSELTKEHYDNMINEFNKELKINQKKVEKIEIAIKNFEKEIKAYDKDLDEVKKDITLIQSLKADYENYQKYKIESEKVQKELEVFLNEHKSKFKDASLKGIKELSYEIERGTSEINSIIKDINEKQDLFKANQTRIVDLNDEIKKMEELEVQIGEIEIDIDHIDKAKELVRRFVTEYMVVKRLVKNIALKTDKYIQDFTAGQYSDLLLDLSGTKKTGLSLKIKDHFNGQYESIEVLSGGDRTALGMALRLAISELMSIIRPTKESPKKNPKINFLLLDEPLAALDEIRRERILKHLTRSRAFSQIFLITHTAIPPDIQTHKIIVEKDHSTGISYARFEKQMILL